MMRANSRRQGQANMIEYLFLTLFLIIIIVALIFLITGFEFFQIGVQQREKTLDRALFLTRELLVTPYLVKEDSLFDDEKLTAAAALECEELQRIFGFRWFAQVRLLGSEPVECTTAAYPECTAWDFCVTGQRNVSYIVPVNIDQSASASVALGTLRVGVYP